MPRRNTLVSLIALPWLALAQDASSTDVATTGTGGDATNDCIVVHAGAHIKTPDGALNGWMDFTYDDASGTWVTIAIYQGLFNSSAFYKYHIHNKAIDASSNCSSAGGHLNPMQAGTCDPTKPELCQEGDLAGKHGDLQGTDSGSANPAPYSDPFLRFWPQPFSILGRSVVIHDPVTGEPWACGNITSNLDGTAGDDDQPTGAPSNYQTDVRSFYDIGAILKGEQYTSSTLPTVTKPNPLPSTVDAADIELDYDAACNAIVKNATTPFDFADPIKLPTQVLPTCSRGGGGGNDATSSAPAPPAGGNGGASSKTAAPSASSAGLGLPGPSSSTTRDPNSGAAALSVRLAPLAALVLACLCL